MQRQTVYLYLETALRVSRGTIIHHQERKQLYLQHPVFVTPLLPPAAIVEELEPVFVCCGWLKSQQDAQFTEFILSENCPTCFAWYHHPSSEAQTTVSTASGICHTVTATCRYRGRVGTGLSVLWVAGTTRNM
jgi:hypothetical protein